MVVMTAMLVIYFYDINTGEIPGELSHVDLIIIFTR